MPGSPLSLDLARMLEEVRKAGGKLGPSILKTSQPGLAKHFVPKATKWPRCESLPMGSNSDSFFPKKWPKSARFLLPQRIPSP